MQRIVITGGSKGIGKAIKTRLGVYGYDVTDWSRSSGVDLTGDFTSTMLIQLHNADIVILNAGSWADRDAFYLNYLWPSLAMNHSAKDAHIILILSNAAYENYGNDDYTTAKAGLLLKARRLQKEGYRVTTISPGTVNTGFWDNAAEDNRKKCIPIEPEEIAELVFMCIQCPSLVTELIVLPRRKVSVESNKI